MAQLQLAQNQVLARICHCVLEKTPAKDKEEVNSLQQGKFRMLQLTFKAMLR